MTNALQACAVNDVAQDVLLMSVRSPAYEFGFVQTTYRSDSAGGRYGATELETTLIPVALHFRTGEPRVRNVPRHAAFAVRFRAAH